jgi:hypothetical protein
VIPLFKATIMKAITSFKILAGVMFLMVSLSGCYYDDLLEQPPIDQPVSFQDDLIPIFDASCNFSGCHITGDVSPDLTADKAFNSLTSEGLIDTNVPENSELYLWVSGQKSLPMPVSGVDPTISATILAWIEQGALNN